MKTKLLKVSLRNQAIYIPQEQLLSHHIQLNESTAGMVTQAKQLGFSFSEKLLRRLNGTHPNYKLAILDALADICGTRKNWTPLVKAWNIPTGESFWDHTATFVANLLGSESGQRLACGHLIPHNTFPLERYTGCPFCGTPFEFGKLENYGHGSKLKVLECWDDDALEQYFRDLLTSRTALDATQTDSLQLLLAEWPLPERVQVGIKETLMVVIKGLVKVEKADEAGRLFKTPNDILRYLWYQHTGYLQLVRPRTILKRSADNDRHRFTPFDQSVKTLRKTRNSLKLKYTRKECRMVAQWLNDLPLEAEQSCEIMHPKRSMWIRFIRALRLAEYARKPGFDKLARLLHVFYHGTYDVWEGRISYHRLRVNAAETFRLLKKRPGLFSRSLFANMLWFGPEETLRHFREILDQVPARLLLTLNMYAPYYFDPEQQRTVRPLGGTRKRIPANRLLSVYSDQQLKAMEKQVEDMALEMIHRRFANQATEAKSIFIDKGLDNFPLPIGERSETVQDRPSALMGTRFPLEGNTIRLYMQWGAGLPAQHLDMDLSCMVAYDGYNDYCSYSRLVTTGCKHSGDIRSIPHQVGTAEYIDLDVDTLYRKGARFVSFTCNAYSNGSLSPNLVVGWMDSKYPMQISSKTGVAYDPSCVQQEVRITQGLNKGLVFGVLDVQQREVIWLEMNFGGQIVGRLDVKTVKMLLAKLSSRLSVGQLLRVKARAQRLTVMDYAPMADEVYDLDWAMNTAAVTQLFLD